MKRIIVMILAAVMAISCFAACSGNGEKGDAKEAFDPEKAFERLRTEVKFDAELEDASEYAEFVFGDAAKGGEIKMYQAGGKLADALILFKLKDEADFDGVEAAVKDYIETAKLEADRYNPQELKKLENTFVRKSGLYYIVCITGDSETARSILN